MGIYKYAQSFASIPLIDFITESPFAFLIDESYWLYLFFVISGYLVAKSTVNSIKDVIVKMINRFFRLALPILFSCILIYVIYRVVGFQNMKTVGLFQCDWYQSFYTKEYSIVTALRSPIDVLIFGKAELNSPYWVLRNMFIGSIAIYLFKYFCSKLMEKHECICFSALVIAMLVLGFVSPIIVACLIGMFIELLEREDTLRKPYFAFWIMLILMAVYVFPPALLSIFFFGSLIICIPKVQWIEKIFSSKPMTFLGDISWGVFSFHWPLICSVGAMALIGLTERVGLIKAYILVFLIVLIMTIVLSTIFHYTFEKLASRITKAISRLI